MATLYLILFDHLKKKSRNTVEGNGVLVGNQGVLRTYHNTTKIRWFAALNDDISVYLRTI